jgi:[ribosomal protein S18]-alanine N-acetyltransferase
MSAQPQLHLQLHPMSAADIDEVVLVEERAYSHPWTRGNFIDSLRAGYDCRVLRREAHLIGYFVLSAAAGESHLLNFTIDLQWQRRGHGRLLLFDVLAAARLAGAERIFLEVRPSNDAGRGLYATFGFAQVGVRPAYYPAASGREDALVLSRDLET